MNDTITLQEQYEALKATQPQLRIRDAAKQLGASEAALVALGNATRLQPEWQDILRELHTLGTVMALTRNDDAVHERHGVYNNISFQGPIGLAVNPDIDLRLFMMHWQYGFAVNENGRHSLQFFDKSGQAVHKVYCTDTTSMDAYHALVEKYRDDNAFGELETTEYPPAAPELPDNTIGINAFRAEWESLKDTHDFYNILRKYKVSRLQAMRLAPEGYAMPVANDTARKILSSAADKQVPIMVFVGNRGCIQIHTGTVEKLMERGPWFNVLDREFSLHLREDAIAYTYAVTKPSEDGDIHSFEAYDKDGEMIIQFFGKRKPGIPELKEWKALFDNLIISR